MLTKKGYIIQKKNNEILINELKKELHVKPVQTFNTNIEPEGFDIYLEDEDTVTIPKFYARTKFGLPEKDITPNGEKINISFKGKLKEKQTFIINQVYPKIVSDDGGLLCLGCGEGKTVLSLYLACQLKVKTLVIVNKTFLLNQWKERISEFTDAKIGIIQQDTVDIENKDIVIGMLQSIAKDKYSYNIFMDFGFVIFDEAHHAPSKYFSRALPIISCKKTLALSATPKRSDKLEKVLFWYFGDIIYKSNTETINNLVVKAYKYNCDDKHFKEYKMYSATKGTDINRPKTITKITEIPERNKFIFNLIKEILQEEGRKILILSDRIEHLKIVKQNLDQHNITTTSFYIGGMKQSKLDEATKAQCIFSTYSMTSEAFDLPELNTLIMMTSRREVEQIIGRITRKNHEIEPTVYDIVDQLPSFNSQFNNGRTKFYEKKKFIIKLFEVEGHKIIKEYDYEKIKKIKKVKEIVFDDINFID
jgi:superfamily II DNA or RNA helicase